MSLINYLISINVIAFILCLVDKIKAIKGWYRISEGCLLFLSIVGGCFGMVLGMKLFRHKTKKTKFKLVYFLCLGYICFLVINFFKY